MSTDGPRYPEYPGEQPAAFPPAAPGPPAPHASAPGATAPRSEELAGWWMRVGAALLDGLILLAVCILPLIGGFALMFVGATYDDATGTLDDVNPLGGVVLGLTAVLYLAFDVWNRGLRVGYRGQSLGKQALGLHVVRDSSREVTGAAEGFFRWLVALLLAWTCIGQVLDLLWPLWDDKNQTIHDKAIGTVVVRR